MRPHDPFSADNEEAVSIHALLAECDAELAAIRLYRRRFNPRTPCGVRPFPANVLPSGVFQFQSTHSLRSATEIVQRLIERGRKFQSTHSLRSATKSPYRNSSRKNCFNPRTPCGVRPCRIYTPFSDFRFQSTHSLRSATDTLPATYQDTEVSIHALLAECDRNPAGKGRQIAGFNPRTPCGVRQKNDKLSSSKGGFQSTHSLRSATAADLIHCYSTEQIILCANLPKKTVIARLHFLSIYLSIFYSQCITPIADLPGNSCELEVGAQAMFNSL